jgi:hypothetical protein
MINHPNCILRVPFNGSSVDLSASARTATNRGTVAYASGVFGQALNANSIGAVDCGVYPYSSTTQQITISCWVYNPGTLGTNSVLFTSCATNWWNGLIFSIAGATNKLVCQMYDGSISNVLYSAEAVPIGSWFHACYVYSGSQIKQYINGIESATPLTAPNYAIASASKMVIGSVQQVPSPYINQSYTFKGKIDDFQMYNIALSPPDIKRIMIGKHPLARS